MRRFIPFALLLASVSAAQPAPETATLPKPALWKVADADTTIYLFGTIHALPPHYRWRTPALDKAIAGSDALVLETVLPDPASATAALLAMGRTAGLPPLVERVPEARRETLAALIQRSGIPAAFLDGLESWASTMLLFGVTVADLGVDPDDGVEKQLQARFAKDRKPIEGLETPEQQLGYLDTLPEAAQRTFLESLLEDPQAARSDFDAMLKAWAAGDEAGIAASFDEDADLSPELRDAILTRRNAAWADWLVKRLHRPGSVLVAIGAGHLNGPGSVRDLLAARGLKAERLQ